jgi:hypothetical protein
MNLQDFVTTTLKQVIQGVQTAQKELGGEGRRYVNPAGRGMVAGRSQDGTPIQDVEFDVAVTVGEETGLSGGISVVGLGLGVRGGSKDTNMSVSRIKFVVPVAFPAGYQSSE